ncbi:hypothetical protein [Planctomycetes bacterium TBK1r]|uniref:Uncharacterized protein n=1 Tax=Stieleria magnilauensis TaxID=2527963 RepID=A0ABX5Y1F2_9BACT|nr:hypothetical protein TBK1r_57660 [Planctomycetes bacterium TBK1r]
MTTLTRVLLTAGALLVMAGCRNTTSTPVSPLGGSSLLSPLSPVQGTATLSPIQPTSGIGTFGAPTRVPPPPTGSYRSPGNYGAPSTYGAPTGNYAPGGSVPNGPSPSGATLGSNGMTRGLTDLSAPAAYAGGVGSGSGVRQTGWIGDASQGNNGFGNGVDPRLSPANQATPTADPAASPRAGGMQVIDLTHAPYPPGYVPPQNRPGAGAFPASAPYPQTAPQTQSNQFPNSQPGFGQPTNSTFVRTANGFSDATSFGDRSNVQTAGRPNSATLPSTEPFPSTTTSGDSDLQWRRPSPRF